MGQQALAEVVVLPRLGVAVGVRLADLVAEVVVVLGGGGVGHARDRGQSGAQQIAVDVVGIRGGVEQLAAAAHGVAQGVEAGEPVAVGVVGGRLRLVELEVLCRVDSVRDADAVRACRGGHAGGVHVAAGGRSLLGAQQVVGLVVGIERGEVGLSVDRLEGLGVVVGQREASAGDDFDPIAEQVEDRDGLGQFPRAIGIGGRRRIGQWRRAVALVGLDDVAGGVVFLHRRVAVGIDHLDLVALRVVVRMGGWRARDGVGVAVVALPEQGAVGADALDLLDDLVVRVVEVGGQPVGRARVAARDHIAPTIELLEGHGPHVAGGGRRGAGAKGEVGGRRVGGGTVEVGVGQAVGDRAGDRVQDDSPDVAEVDSRGRHGRAHRRRLIRHPDVRGIRGHGKGGQVDGGAIGRRSDEGDPLARDRILQLDQDLGWGIVGDRADVLPADRRAGPCCGA